MGGERPPHPPLPHRQRILQTSPGAVPAETAEALRAFCASVHDIEAAYVCAVENIYKDGEIVQALRFSMQLKGPVVTSDDSRAFLLEVLPRLGSEHPDLMRELGCCVLGDASIAVRQENALRIY
jgi:hypothetical protein